MHATTIVAVLEVMTEIDVRVGCRVGSTRSVYVRTCTLTHSTVGIVAVSWLSANGLTILEGRTESDCKRLSEIVHHRTWVRGAGACNYTSCTSTHA